MTAVLYFVDIYFVLVKAYTPSKAGIQLLYYTPGIGSKHSSPLLKSQSPNLTSWGLPRNVHVQHLPPPNLPSPLPRQHYRSNRHQCPRLRPTRRPHPNHLRHDGPYRLWHRSPLHAHVSPRHRFLPQQYRLSNLNDVIRCPFRWCHIHDAHGYSFQQ